METGSKKLVILSYAIVCFHPSVSLTNEKICCAISEDKIAICEKTAGLGSGNFSDLNSACQKVVVPVKIFQFQDMINENPFLDTFRGHSKRTILFNFCKARFLLSFSFVCFCQAYFFLNYLWVYVRQRSYFTFVYFLVYFSGFLSDNGIHFSCLFS